MPIVAAEGSQHARFNVLQIDIRQKSAGLWVGDGKE
jgi:hypothetical protein